VLLLAYLLGNPGSVLLVDEPDAHLEILRQRQIYATLTEVAHSSGSQIVAASHSEVILNEAANRDVVVAFVGKPHRIDDRGSQVLKALRSIGFQDYYVAETTGWVLYLEGPTDLAILQAFASTLEHPAASVLERPFVHYIENRTNRAEEHYYGIREAKPDLVGFVLTDRLEHEPVQGEGLTFRQWTRREIENYLCYPEVLEEYAGSLARERSSTHGPLFASVDEQRFLRTMHEVVRRRIPPAAFDNRADRWWASVKASDEFLDPVFEEFFERLDLPNLMRKTDYHRLAARVPRGLIADEVAEVLDAVLEVAKLAVPVTNGMEGDDEDE
jgi:hypothetical protein